MDRLTLTSRQVATLRLRTLGIIRDESGVHDSPVAVVRHLLAAQAQDFTASRWAVGLRAGVDESAVTAAFDRGEIVRSWPMRGTVHVTAAGDLPWMLDLTGVRQLRPKPLMRRWEALGIDEPMMEDVRDTVVAALSGGNRMTRTELRDLLTDHGTDVTGQRMYHFVWYLAQTGTLVQGPTRDGEHQLVLLDEWIPAPRTLTRAEALREIVERYLASHGPARVDDMTWWTGLTTGDIRQGIEEADGRVIAATHASTGEALYLTADTLGRHDPDPATVRRSTVALAPFDEHLLGYRGRDDVVDPAHARAIDPMRNGVFRATIVHAGRVVAIWRVTRRARGVAVTLVPLNGLTSAQRTGAERALRRWAEFRGETVLSVSVDGESVS